MNLLAIVSRYPEIGKVKKRLSTKFGQEKTVELSFMILKDLEKEHKNREYVLQFYIKPERQIPNFKKIFPNSFVFPQNGFDLQHVITHILSEETKKFDKVVILRADSPISTESILHVFEDLDTYDFVVGPLENGEIYLIGAKKPFDFEDIDFSSPSCSDRVILKLQQQAMKVKEKEIRIAFQSISDLILLRDIIDKNKYPNTFKFLSLKGPKDRAVSLQ